MDDRRKAVGPRRCYLPATEEHERHHFCANRQRTAKFSSLSGLLLAVVYAQCSRLANVYLLLVALLQICTNLVPEQRLTAAVPLAIVVALSVLREALEDWRRHRIDRHNDSRPTRVLRAGLFKTVQWRDVQVCEHLAGVISASAALAPVMVCLHSRDSLRTRRWAISCASTKARTSQPTSSCSRRVERKVCHSTLPLPAKQQSLLSLQLRRSLPLRLSLLTVATAAAADLFS